MGVARLEKVTIIAPRSEYADVAKALAQFEDFHPAEGVPQSFDPGVQDLTVKAVKLFAQADQAAKDLNMKLMPGQMDVVFRGEKVPRSSFQAAGWKDLLDKAGADLDPITEEVRAQKGELQKFQKEEADSEAMMGTLSIVSGFAADLSGLADLSLFRGAISIVPNDRLAEFAKSIPDAIFLTRGVSKEHTLVLVVVKKAEEARLEKTLKLLDLKPLTLPSSLPQNPAEAYRQAVRDHESAVAERVKAEERMDDIRKKSGTTLLALRELAEAARETLDEARVSGGMQRMAMISGFIPAKRDEQMKQRFGKWIVQTEDVRPGEEGEKVPVLMQNSLATGLFQQITQEQGIPGGHEVDPTPIVSYVFPAFFGMMFADAGHGLVLSLFMLFVRQRSAGNTRKWANMFLVAGISSIIFGVIFGEFFELPFSRLGIAIPPLVEIINRAGAIDSFNFLPSAFDGVNLVLIVSILIGVAHLVTAIGLDVYQSYREHNPIELWLEHVPALTMYLAGVGYGLAFVGAGYKFDVLSSSAPNPLLGVPNNLVGEVSLAVLIPSMLVLLAGKGVAIAAGRLKDGSVLGALSNGGLEVFERISLYMSNTISYIRLAVMLLVHAALLLITNEYFAPWNNLTYLPVWIFLNVLIIAFEAMIVYIQDLRLHLYEFFTKFYRGTGSPFRKIFPDKPRVSIEWL